jgi:hypothetical protein
LIGKFHCESQSIQKCHITRALSFNGGGTNHDHQPSPFMKNIRTIVICSIALLVVAGCSSTLEKKSQGLHLGMGKQTCIDTLGKHYAVVASRMEPSGTPVSVLRFREPKQDDLFLYFRNDKLVQWGDIEVLKGMPPAAPQ